MSVAKITVLYHSADYDGIFCREIARKFLGDKDVKLIGWNFGERQVQVPSEGPVYIMDLSPECLVPTPDVLRRMIWIDHHKSSIEKYPPETPGYRIDGVAACRLAWQWFLNEHFKASRTNPAPGLPTKQEFVDRIVNEPLAVRLAGEYDVWDKRDPLAETLQYGLRCLELGADFWEALLSGGAVGEKSVTDMIGHGRIAQTYARKTDADLVNHKSFRVKWEGVDFLCINTGRFNSLTFAALDKPETGHDALMGFMWNGKCWTVSLYHAAHRTDIDLSLIAVKYGGGGHRGACGFTCKTLPPFLA